MKQKWENLTNKVANFFFSSMVSFHEILENIIFPELIEDVPMLIFKNVIILSFTFHSSIEL